MKHISKSCSVLIAEQITVGDKIGEGTFHVAHKAQISGEHKLFVIKHPKDRTLVCITLLCFVFVSRPPE